MKNNNKSTIYINQDLCANCKKCESDCTSLAINIDNYSVSETCIGCGHCVAICDSSAISMNSENTITLNQNLPTPEQFYNLSTHTRTCRNFKNKDVSPEIIKKIIDNIAHYPSASNTRKVDLTIITNPETIKRLNDYTANKLLKLFKTVTNPFVKSILRLFVSKSEIKKLKSYKELFEKKVAKNSNNITYEAPVVIVFHAPKQKTGMLQTDADIWSTYTSLYASTFGLGTCFNGFIVKALNKDKKAKKEFGIPPQNDIFISLLLGYPKYSYTNETGREIPSITLIK